MNSVRSSTNKRPATEEELEIYAYIAEKATKVAVELARLIKHAPKDKGGIILIHGAVNSGKTIVACKLFDFLEENGRVVTASQPAVDRSDVPQGKYYSRSGVEKEALSFENKADIVRLFNRADIVLVDEIHFVPYELQTPFLKEALAFVSRGGWLVCLGCVRTAQGGVFVLPALLKEYATKSIELTATCQKCGRKGAKYNQRLINGVPTVLEDPELIEPSERVIYEPRCDDCIVMVG